MEKLISVLTLSKKARKLIMGFDVVKEAVLDQTAKLVLLSKDVSPKTQKEVTFICQKHQMNTVVVPLEMDELWYLLGKKAAVLAVTDQGFAEKIVSLLQAE